MSGKFFPNLVEQKFLFNFSKKYKSKVTVRIVAEDN